MNSKKKVVSGILATAMLAGCGVTIEQPERELESKGEPAGGTIHTDTFVQGDLVGGYADLLFVVDNSGSMHDDQVRLGNGFNTFINWVTQENVDFHIGITTTDMDPGGANGAFVGTPAVLDENTPNLLDVFKANVMVGTNGSPYEQGIAPAAAALTEPLRSTVNAGFLRENAKLYVIFVTDEDDQSPLTVAEYVQQFQALKADPAMVHFTAIAAETNNTCGAYDGLRYQEIVGSTGGLFGSICQEDFGQTLQQLAFEVTSASGEYFLTQIPIPETIAVKVDGVDQPAANWEYHPATNSVELLPAHIPAPGATITITYEIAGTGSECLANGEVVYDLDGGEESWKFYCAEVPAGVTKLVMHSWNGRGDADLYVKLGSEPGEGAYDWRAAIEEQDETLVLENPAAGTYWIGVYGFHRYEDVNLQAIWIGGEQGGSGPDSHVVISQVSYDTPGTDGLEEFVELFNPTNAPVALDGWNLTDNGGSFPLSGTLAPGAYLTVARDAAGHQALYGKAPGLAGLTLNLGNTGDWLMLEGADASTVDFVAWEGASTGWTISSPTGSSIERDDPSLDTDRETDWVVRTPAAPRG